MVFLTESIKDATTGHAAVDTATTKDATTDHAAEIGSKNGDSVFPFASVYLLPVEYLMVLLFVFAVILSVRACLKNCRPTYRGTFYAPVPELPPPAV